MTRKTLNIAQSNEGIFLVIADNESSSRNASSTVSVFFLGGLLSHEVFSLRFFLSSFSNIVNSFLCKSVCQRLVSHMTEVRQKLYLDQTRLKM